MIPILDFLSYEAYNKLGVRKSVWNESFEYFVPIFINEEHWKKSFTIFRDMIVEFYNLKTYETSYGIKFLNSMIVIMMKGEVHASLKAIEGYLMFFEMLSYLVKRASSIERSINQKVLMFCKNKNCRSKSQVPNFGEFFPLVALSDCDWKSIKPFIIEEVFERNAFWIDKGNSNIFHDKMLSSYGIAIKVFPFVKVSLKVIMFNFMFFEIYKA